MINNIVDNTNANNDTIATENKPKCAACVIIILRLSIITTSKIRPTISNRLDDACRFLDSGVPLIKSTAMRETIIEKTNIHLQLKNVAIIPPNKDAKPEPPQDPIDQKLSAR